MLLALYDGRRTRAELAGSGAIGTCPWTQRPVKAHVGLIRQYWAYVGGQPRWERGYEPESEWHLAWKSPIEDSNCEVIFDSKLEHRADILGADNTVIEIQRSTIDLRDSQERIRFYRSETGRRVVWVVDIQEFWQIRFSLVRMPEKYRIFRVEWNPRRTWLWDIAATTDTHLYLEFNQRSDKLLHSWVHEEVMYAKYITKQEFFMRYLNAVAKHECTGFSAAAKERLCGVA
jgi:competence CoiA-like predicted nuclease